MNSTHTTQLDRFDALRRALGGYALTFEQADALLTVAKLDATTAETLTRMITTRVANLSAGSYATRHAG